MAEQLLFGTADRMIGTLGSLVAKEIVLLWGVEGELQSLRNTVSRIKAVLLDAVEKHALGNNAVRDWLGKLEDAMYEADDLLDAVSTEALRRELMTRDKKAIQLRIFFSKSNQLASGLKMAHKIKAIRERLDAINADRRFHLEERHVETRVGGKRDNTHSIVCAEAVIGRDEDKMAVIHRLLDSNVEEKVTIHPIVGIDGLGKTTLAQLIFNDDQIRKHFELKMWVFVSDPFDVENVAGKILESMKRKPAERNIWEGILIRKVKGKKYFLVLDDVRSEDHEKWSSLKQLLMGGAKGSRIVVTTHSEEVASTIRREKFGGVMKTVESYTLRGLDDGESWSLFKQMAFENGQEPENPSIVKLGKQILQKCSGVPLAIRTIGSLLGSKNPETEWLSFKNNELSKLSGQNENHILTTLKLSYDHLPSHLKDCFAYCRLFPKDYEIKRSTLIQLWIAQGFVKLSDKKQCLEDVGNEYFKDLLCRSFFQEDKADWFDNIMRYKMHDLMHDVAISVAGSIITTLDAKERNVGEKTRHVSVVGSDIDALSITTSLCNASSMRTLLSCSTSDNNFWGESECEAIFSSSKFLRVLDLRSRNLDFLPSSIWKLKHLRYLDLSLNENLTKLPNSIMRLQNLQTIKLSYCHKLEELPRDIEKLVNLRHLEIDQCSQLTYMPRGLGQLSNLQTLSYFVVDKDPLSRYSSGLRELNGLNNLRGELRITNLRHVKLVTSEGKAANLKEKQYLHTLLLDWNSEGGGNDSDVNFDDDLLLKVLEPHPNLKRLGLEGNLCSTLPSWLLSLTNLVRFELRKCRKCPYLPPLSQLPSLECLILSNLDALEYISYSNEFSSSSSASPPFFPSLKEFSLIACCNLKGWWWMRGSSVEVNNDTNNSVEITEHPLLPSFSCLSTLVIRNCPKLTSLPMFPHLEEKLELDNASWKPVQQTMMMNMAALQSPTSTATASSSSTPLSKLKSISLSSVADLETLPEWLKNLTSLESLRIVSCDKFNSLSLQDLDLSYCPALELANDDDGMQWQGLKSLLSLEFRSLPKLVSLPLGLQHATTLQWLKISKCENLTAIPEWIRNYTSLQALRIRECSSLTSLPEGMRSLKSLKSLKIVKCPILLKRIKGGACEDWGKISHIRNLELRLS